MKSILTLFFIIICNSVIIAQNEQVKVMGGSEPEIITTSQIKTNSGLVKKNLKLLTIGVGNFEDKEYNYLSSYLNSTDSKDSKTSITYFKKDYECKTDSLFGYVKKIVLLNKLKDISEDEVSSSDIIIISILSHGEEKGGKYYLICSDTKSSQLKETAISGTEILYYLKILADKGALVIVFLDTCNAGAILGELGDYSPKNNGILAIYASSQKDESAKQIYEKTFFTESIRNTFQYKNTDAFLPGCLTLKSLRNQINSAVSNQPKSWQQNPETKFIPDKGRIDGYEIEDYPIMTTPNTDIKETDNDDKKHSNINPQFYLGTAFGYPYASIYAGLSLWQHLKVEIGCSYLNVKESDDVYLYSSSNPSPYGYRYSSNNFRLFIQTGWEIGLGKNWFISPMAGVSYLGLSGEPIEGYESGSGIGERVSGFCLTTNVRLSYAPFKNKHWQLNITAGKEWGIGDSNYKLIRDYIDHKTIEGFRGQMGITYNF